MNYKLNELSFNLISLMLGFFIAIVLSTTPTQTGDSSILAASFITTYSEIINYIIYKKEQRKLTIISILKYTKIGIIYGLFVEAFKLGS